jgi:glycosyltransferase involved in cell wall biosynthesis
MACGVPVMVTPQVNLAREIDSAQAGWVVAFKELSNGLAVVMEDNGERLRRGKIAYEYAKRYSWAKVGTDLADFYRQILERL